MNEEVLMILKMVEEGKISADKAKELIDALKNTSEDTTAVAPKIYDEQFLRVEVLSHEGDKVNIKLPIKVIREVVKVTGKLPISTHVKGMEEIDIEALMDTIVSCLDKEVMGEIVDVRSSEGDIVKIVID